MGVLTCWNCGDLQDYRINGKDWCRECIRLYRSMGADLPDEQNLSYQDVDYDWPPADEDK